MRIMHAQGLVRMAYAHEVCAWRAGEAQRRGGSWKFLPDAQPSLVAHTSVKRAESSLAGAFGILRESPNTTQPAYNSRVSSLRSL